jgi:hypothetical protein
VQGMKRTRRAVIPDKESRQAEGDRVNNR